MMEKQKREVMGKHAGRLQGARPIRANHFQEAYLSRALNSKGSKSREGSEQYMRKNINMVKVVIMVMVLTVALVVMVLGSISRATASTPVDWNCDVINTVALADPQAQHGSTLGHKIVLARTAAIGLAQGQLLGILEGIRIDRVTTIKEAILTSDLIEKKVEGLIKGAMIIEEGVNELDLYEVRLAVKLHDVARALEVEAPEKAMDETGLSAVLDEDVPEFHREHDLNQTHLGLDGEDVSSMTLQDYLLKAKTNSRYARSKKVSSEDKQSKTSMVASTFEAQHEVIEAAPQTSQYTSLIVDGRMFGELTRDRAPVIYSEDGKVLYRGWDVQYHDKLSNAIRMPAAGQKPFVVDAVGLKTVGDDNSSPHVVISRKAARTLQQANKAQGFLDEGRVMILIK